MASTAGASFLFFCDGNKTVGRGHLSRCLNLARQLRILRPATPIAFCGRYDDYSRRWLRSYRFPIRSLPNSRGADAAALARIASRFDHLIVDNYLLHQKQIRVLAKGPFKLIVIDDFNALDLSAADLVINFTVGAERHRYNARRSALGLRYFPAKPELQRLRRLNNRPPRPTVMNVLVSLTGTRAAALLAKTLQILDESLKGCRVLYIADKPIAQRFSGRNRIENIAPDPAIERRLARTDLVVSGAGFMRYECGYCRIPNASIGLNSGQKRDGRRFIPLKTTLDLGSADSFHPASAKRRLIEFLRKPDARLAQWRACARAFDAAAPERLARAVAAV